jgi:hypothetical protein
VVLLLSIVLGLILIYATHSTLPWWGFLVACALSSVCILFFGAQYGITGFNYIIQPIIQLVGGYLHPGHPMANMYFVLFGYNSVIQGQLLLKDLKFAQYAHLAPRVTFVMQLVSPSRNDFPSAYSDMTKVGTFVGSIVAFVMMDSITKNQREVLLSGSSNGTWSGQGVQAFNSQAVAWGMAKELFNVGGRYQWITLSLLLGFILPFPFWIGHKLLGPAWHLDYWNTPIIANFVGLLSNGINSVTLMWFGIGWFSQGYLRRYRPNWFIKYNYILSAAMDGGTQVMVFILSFAVLGAGGPQRKFPIYWGNNRDGNNDYCFKLPDSDGDGG